MARAFTIPPYEKSPLFRIHSGVFLDSLQQGGNATAEFVQRSTLQQGTRCGATETAGSSRELRDGLRTVRHSRDGSAIQGSRELRDAGQPEQARFLCCVRYAGDGRGRSRERRGQAILG